MSDRIVLAVDGGNSKTDLALVRADGALLAHVRGPLSSPHHLGLEKSVALLQALLDEAAEAACTNGSALAVAQVFLAGVDFPAEEEVLRAALELRRLAGHVVVGNDTLALLRAGTERGWGVAVVCGAGINCVGVGPDGRRVRFDSLGDFSGDWGGGPDVGLAAVSAGARSADGRGPKTVFEQLAAKHYGYADATALARALHAREIPPERLGELAPLVFEHADTDAVAGSIVDRLADEVVALARAALTRLELTDEEVDVVLGGGLLRAGNRRLLARIEDELRAVGPALHVTTPSSPPVVGAALLGLDRIGANGAAQARLREELGRAL